jgi:DNA-binding transcriptional MerR regulator
MKNDLKQIDKINTLKEQGVPNKMIMSVLELENDIDAILAEHAKNENLLTAEQVAEMLQGILGNKGIKKE